MKLTDAQFEGQTKAKLGNTEIRSLVDGIVYEKLSYFLEENPAVARAILDKGVGAARAREAARQCPGTDPAQVRPGDRLAARQAGRLLGAGY